MDPRCQWCGAFKKNSFAQCGGCARFPVQHRVCDLTYSRLPGREHLSSKCQSFSIKLDGKHIGFINYDHTRPISQGGPSWMAYGDLYEGEVVFEKTFKATLREVRRLVEKRTGARHD